MPLDIRHTKWSLAYWVRLKDCEVEHHTATVLACWEYTSRQGSGFGWTVGKIADERNLRELEVGPSVVIEGFLPWLLPLPWLLLFTDGPQEQAFMFLNLMCRYVED